MPSTEINFVHVLVASMVTAICTGLGVVPFFFVKNVSKRFLGIGNAIAAGLMLGASLGLTWEAGSIGVAKLVVGLATGAVLVIATRWLLPNASNDSTHKFSQLSNAGFRKLLIIMGVMTAHSFAEGIGVGVSFGGREGLGQLISTAIAVHNIPEGIAICLVLIPLGFSKIKACMWSIFSSLPQPLMAVPAFLFVLVFEPILPIGLGLAAGAMFYMVFFELLPESFESTNISTSILVCALSTGSMLLFQAVL